MVDEELVDAERAQLRRYLTLQKVAWGIVCKWKWLFLLSLLLLGGGFTAWLRFKSATGMARFEATTRMLFSPQKVAKLENISDRQLLSVIERSSLKFRVGERLGLSAGETSRLRDDMVIKQERHPSNLFTLTAEAPTLKGAVQKANTYAEILTEEYVAYRTVDLENRRGSIEARRKTFMDQLAENESAMANLKAKTGVVSPQETLTTLNMLISDQRRNLSALGVDIANEEMRQRKLKDKVGKIGAVIIGNAAAIRRRAEAIATLDKDIAQLRVLYTDLNPKVAGKIHDRAVLVKEMQDFLKAKGVEELEVERIDEIEKAAGELAESGTRLDALSERRRALEQELKDNEKRADQLMSMIPEYERLSALHDDLEHSVRQQGEELNDIAYLKSALHNDLRQIERAGDAADNSGLAAKTIIKAVLGTVVCVGSLLFWVLALEFAFGKVRGGKEVMAYDNITFLGSLPKAGKLPKDEAREVMGVVALRLLGADVPRGVILVCRLPGSATKTDFPEVLDYTATMSGVRVFVLTVVSSATFTPPEDVEQMIGTIRKDARGWFPVSNRYALAPTELQMLQADLAELRNSFDTVFIQMEGGFRKGGSFFDQLLGISETVLLSLGTSRTKRSWFGYVRRHVEAAGKPLLAIATNASAKIVRKEMDAK